MKSSSWTTGVLTVVIALSFAAVAHGDDVLPGLDLWTTPAGGAVENFGTGADPIPADFFGPGSDPFFGEVTFVGEPLGTYEGQPAGGADTIVERLAPASLPANGSSDVIPVEIVALSLTSIEPIIVTFNGGLNPTPFDVHVGLGLPQSNGSMQIDRVTSQGGTYDATINVCPLFTFTESGNPGNIHALDYCAVLNPGGRPIAVNGQAWAYDIKQPQNSPLSGPNFVVIGPTHHDGPHPTANPVERATSTLVPAMDAWGLSVLSLILAGLGAVVVLRRRVTA